MSKKSKSILIWCLIGIFLFSYLLTLWVHFSPWEIPFGLFMVLNSIFSFLRWPSITIALVLALTNKRSPIAQEQSAGSAEAQTPTKETNWALIIVLSIIAIVGILSAAFFALIMMGAQYI